MAYSLFVFFNNICYASIICQAVYKAHLILYFISYKDPRIYYYTHLIKEEEENKVQRTEIITRILGQACWFLKFVLHFQLPYIDPKETLKENFT